MKSKDILNAMTDIDPATVEAAAAPVPRRSGTGKRAALIAACAALLAAAVVTVLLVLNRTGPDVPPEPGTTTADTAPGESGAAPTEAHTEPPAPLHTGGMWVDTREKKELSVKPKKEASIEFPELPWKLRPLYMQVGTLEYEGAVYGDAYEYTGDPVREGLVSAACATGTVTAAGEDGKPADIGIRLYPMTGGTPARRLFVRFDGSDIWAAYCLQGFVKPATWGELCAGLHLSEQRMPFLRGEDKRSSGVSMFSLTDADSRAIWAMLGTVTDAPGYACDDVTYEETGKELFSVSSPSTALGPVRLNLQLYENGWMVTAVERYGCAFHVGPAFVAELAAYLEAHGIPVDDPADLPGSKQYVYGTVTETGEGWFKLNDGISLADPSEAVEFTVISNMVEVYYSSKWLKPGMLVKVTHEGIWADEPTVIRTVDSVAEIYIGGDGEPVVQE